MDKAAQGTTGNKQFREPRDKPTPGTLRDRLAQARPTHPLPLSYAKPQNVTVKLFRDTLYSTLEIAIEHGHVRTSPEQLPC